MRVYPYTKYSFAAAIAFLIAWICYINGMINDIEYTSKMLDISAFFLILIAAWFAHKSIKESQ